MLKRALVVTIGICMIGLAGCAELKDLRAQNKNLRERLNAVQGERDTLLSEREALAGERDGFRAKLSQTEDEARRSTQLVAELQAERNRLERQRRELMSILENIEGITVEQRAEGNFIVMENEILFDPGRIVLTDAATLSLDKISQYLLAQEGLIVRIDGHTDGVPIKASPWKDNYHLSAMRAHAVMRHLLDKGMPGASMYIAGYGPNRPLDTPENPTDDMPRNRRVEILLIPAGGRSITEILASFKE